MKKTTTGPPQPVNLNIPELRARALERLWQNLREPLLELAELDKLQQLLNSNLVRSPSTPAPNGTGNAHPTGKRPYRVYAAGPPIQALVEEALTDQPQLVGQLRDRILANHPERPAAHLKGGNISAVLRRLEERGRVEEGSLGHRRAVWSWKPGGSAAPETPMKTQGRGPRATPGVQEERQAAILRLLRERGAGMANREILDGLTASGALRGQLAMSENPGGALRQFMKRLEAMDLVTQKTISKNPLRTIWLLSPKGRAAAKQP